ncbi:MAG: 2OG-Fe(II) oxygenase [Burkholderiales bacterium]|nr:2OG-Fe(II) oxygenase [Burkholderiales bacterium]
MTDALVTAELRRWLLAQLEAGRSSAAILAAMRDAGWGHAQAAATLEQVVAESEEGTGVRGQGRTPAPGSSGLPSGSRAQQMSPADIASQLAAGPATNDDSTASMPGPALDGAPSQIVADGHRVQVLAVMQRPRLVVFGGLLDDAECDALVELARPRLARSETVDTATGGSEVNAARTSDGMFFGRGETPLLTRIERRIAALLRWPIERGEGLQVLRYRPGAEYRPHHDHFDPERPGSAAVLARGGQRVATLVIYLASPDGGGATSFPDAGIEVAPVKGNAVFFAYEAPQPWTRTLHGGAPVLGGEKWVATKWLRQRRFD